MQRLGSLLAVVMFVMLTGAAAAQTPEGLVVAITSPVDGQQLFGLTNISGSAEDPTAFESYTLEYNDLGDPTAPWLLVQPRVQQQVKNNVLGIWNTNLVPDGTYRLRLRVFLQDGQVSEFVVSDLKVVNSVPTPVPTAASGAAIEATPAVPTPGPSPTSLIAQPPSSNPSAGVVVGPAASDGGPGSGESEPLNFEAPATKTTRINTSRVRGAFCTGVYLTLGMFGIMLVYVLIRGRIRPFTRRLIWQIQDEVDDNRR
jgi:hypothetical protein